MVTTGNGGARSLSLMPGRGISHIMTRKHIKDLCIGVSLIVCSVFLFFNGAYTIEVGLILAMLTLLWLMG